MSEPNPVQADMSKKSPAFETAPNGFSFRVVLGYAFQFLFIGLYLPYFPLWLESKSLTPVEISTVLAVPLIIRVLISGNFMVYADGRKDRANVLSFLSVVSALIFLLYGWVHTFIAIMTVTIAFNVFFNPVLPVLEAITYAGVRRFNADYGRIRLWGSLVFILANFGGGALLAGYAPSAILYALIAVTLAGALVSFAIPRIGRKNRGQTTHKLSRWQLLRNPAFFLIVVSEGLIQASHALLYGFGSIYWVSIGYSGYMIGWLWAIGVVAEIVLFQFAGNVLQRFSFKHLIYIGGFGALVRWVLFPSIETVGQFAILQVLHGLSFGAVHVGAMHYIMHSVPEEKIGSAQGASFILTGLTMGMAILVSGPIYAALGIYGFYVMAGICALALILLWLAPDTQPQSSGSGG